MAEHQTDQRAGTTLPAFLDNLSAVAYVADPESLTVLWANRAARAAVGRDPTGEACFEVFWGRTEPCDGCGVVPGTSLRHHGPSGRDYRVAVQCARWVDGREARIALAEDVTEQEEAARRLRDSERRLTVQQRITEIFATVPDEGMYGRVLEVVLEQMESPYGVFGYLDESGGLVAPSMTRSIWDECDVADKRIVFPRQTWGGALWCTALREGRSLRRNEPSRVPAGHIAIERNLDIPILLRGAAIGLLQVANKACDYTDEDAARLEGIAQQVAPLLAARLTRDREAEARLGAEESLRGSLERYSALHEHLPDGVVLIVPATGRAVEFNEAAHRALGYTREEFAELAISDYEATEDPAATAAHVERVFALGRDDFETVHRTKQGEPRNVLVTVQSLRLAEGPRLIAVFRDVTLAKRAEEDLQRQLDQYASVLRTTQDGYWLVDASGRLLDTNDAYCRMSGYSREELLQLGVDALEATESREDTEAHMRRVAEQGMDRFETRHRAKDGRVYDVEASVRYWTATGQIICFLRDVTERKQAESELRRRETLFRSLLEHLPQRIALKDTRSVYASCNLLYAHDLGIEPDGIVGKDDYAFHPRDLADAYRADDREVMESGVPKDIEERYEVGGERRWVHTTKVPYHDGEGRVAGVVLVWEDVTERKEAGIALTARTVELRRSNRELEQFAYVASHDLQEPLRGISGFADLLMRRYKGQLDDTADEYLTFIAEGAARLGQMIRDLLVFSRIGTRGEEPVPVDSGAILEDALSAIAVSVEEAGAVITHDPMPTIVADAGQIRQVFQNLLSNAIKFRGEEPPRVHVSASESDTEWRFTVTDNGIGIAPAHVERIFVIFQRLESRAKYAGTGIGLAICKRVVERHGGRIGVESDPGKGATFWFTIAKQEVAE